LVRLLQQPKQQDQQEAAGGSGEATSRRRWLHDDRASAAGLQRNFDSLDFEGKWLFWACGAKNFLRLRHALKGLRLWAVVATSRPEVEKSNPETDRDRPVKSGGLV
jgi:hypothetical protein